MVRNGSFWWELEKLLRQNINSRLVMQSEADAYPVADNRTEVVEFYKTSKLEIIEQADPAVITPPPWIGIPPELEIYRKRGHRRLDPRTYASHCRQCIWGCLMPVEMIIDQWKPDKIQYRTETFCYGPKSCELYKAGPTRKVPGRKGMTWEEEDWVDEDAVAHRGVDFFQLLLALCKRSLQ